MSDLCPKQYVFSDKAIRIAIILTTLAGCAGVIMTDIPDEVVFIYTVFALAAIAGMSFWEDSSPKGKSNV